MTPATKKGANSPANSSASSAAKAVTAEAWMAELERLSASLPQNVPLSTQLYLRRALESAAKATRGGRPGGFGASWKARRHVGRQAPLFCYMRCCCFLHYQRPCVSGHGAVDGVSRRATRLSPPKGPRCAHAVLA